MKKYFIFIFVLLMVLLPVLSFAQPSEGTGLVTCTAAKDCDWNALLAMINKVINFALFALALPIAAIMFAWAGVLMVTSAGSTEARSKAKGIFGNVVWGLVLAVAAWLIVSTLLTILGYDGTWIGLKFGV